MEVSCSRDNSGHASGVMGSRGYLRSPRAPGRGPASAVWRSAAHRRDGRPWHSAVLFARALHYLRVAAAANRENGRQTVPAAGVRGPTHLTRHILGQSPIGHHGLTLTGRSHSRCLSPSSVGRHNDPLHHAPGHPLLTSNCVSRPPHQHQTPRPTERHPFDSHTTPRFAEFIRNSTRSQTGKMAAVDETFSTLVRNVPSITAKPRRHWRTART